jgi:hypothetical protein
MEAKIKKKRFKIAGSSMYGIETWTWTWTWTEDGWMRYPNKAKKEKEKEKEPSDVEKQPLISRIISYQRYR